MRRAIVLWALVALPGCVAFAVDQEERCAEINARIVDCLGEGLPAITCSGITDRDVELTEQALDRADCIFLREAFPLDGDFRSASCVASGTGCTDTLNPLPDHQPTRLPLVLVNGIDTSPLFRYSDRIIDTLRDEAGNVVFLATLPAYETSLVRAQVLLARVNQIRDLTGAPQVNLICHSLGGFDCRYLVSPGGLAFDLGLDQTAIASSVASITTVSTAHRGTRIADVALGYVPDLVDDELTNKAISFFANWFTEGAPLDDAHLRASIGSLALAQAAAFNERVVNADGIYYQSWGGFSRPFGQASPEYDTAVRRDCMADDGENGLALFGGVHDFMAVPLIGGDEILEDEDAGSDGVLPNDGLCPVASARWGRFRGCVPADHMEQLGQRNLPDANVRTGIDIAHFYAAIAKDLAEMGY